MTPQTPNPPAVSSPEQTASALLAPPQAQREQTAFELIRQYEDPLKNLTDRHICMAIDREKVLQYAIIRRNDFYYRGNQHLVPIFAGSGDAIDFKPVNNQMLLKSGNAQAGNVPMFDYVINHFRGDVRKFVGVLGSKSPNVKARPSWQRDDAGDRRANIANDVAQYLRQQWDVEAANRMLVLSLAKNGTTFLYTPWVADGDRYGFHQEPVYSLQDQKVSPDGFSCPTCGSLTPNPNPNQMIRCANPTCGRPLSPANFRPGPTVQVPTITDMKEYANGAVELYVHSSYDVTTNFHIKDLEHCPWLWLEFREDAAALCATYPDRGLEDDLENERMGMQSMGGSSSSLGELSRTQASSVTGYAYFERPNRWLHSRFWIRPAMYAYLLKSGTGGDQGQEIVSFLKLNYPRGLKLSFVNRKLVNAEHERLDEVWAVCKPETSEYLYADPIFNDYIQGADILNDAWNINIQLLETSIPALLFDPNILDPKKVRNGFQPNEFVPMIPGAGAKAQDSFFKIPTSDPDAKRVEFQKVVVETLREIIGLLPPIWGGDDNVQTAEQARRRLNQALMVLATVWNEMRNAWAKAFRNGCRQIARYSLGHLVSSQGDPESVTTQDVADVSELLLGGWDFECDQGIPMNWAQLRDFVTSLFTMNPDMAQMLGFNDPDNFEKISEGVGVPGWTIPGQKERTAVRILIAQLQAEAPIMGPTGPMPSRPIDFQVTWNPQTTLKVIHDWLMSQDGISAQGTPGYDNVVAAGMAALQATMPPPPPGGPGAPPPGAPPPGAGALPPAQGDAGLPGPLQSAEPPPAPEPPLPPLNPPQGGVTLPGAAMIQ